MAEVQTLRKGNMYEEGGNLWRVLEYQHIKVARGGATIRLKVRNVRTGATIEKTYNNGTKMNNAQLESSEVEYLYNDEDFYYFMDRKTHEQFPLAEETLEGIIDFMVHNQVVTLETYENEPINIALPTTVDLKVDWAEAAVTGNTANVPNKQIRLETGLELQAPMFVTEGDIITVDTREGGKYVTRVKQ